MKIPFLDLSGSNTVIKKQLMQEFENVLDREWYILGEKLEAFEREYAAYHPVNHCIGVGNGLDALVICLKALGIGRGDEVIIPANTFVATALAVSFVGAEIVLVDPDAKTFNIRADGVEKVITKKTKAIIPVHLYGQSCEMVGLMDIARGHGIKVVEDNAQSQGSMFNDRKTGTWGEINATSFYPGKNLGALGDAGAITTNDPTLAKAAKMYRNYGAEKKYHHTVQGQNSRLDEMQAAFLSVKLKYLDQSIGDRRKVASLYDSQLAGVGDIQIPVLAKGATHTYHLYVIQTAKRQELQAYLTERGVDTLVHYPITVQKQEAYASSFKSGLNFPVSDRLSQTILSLPIYPGLSDEKCGYITDLIRSFFNR